MDPRRGKATRTASKAGTEVPKVSVRSSRGARTERSESPAAPKAAQANAGRGGSARGSGSQQRKSAPDSRERPQVRAPGARAKKAPVRAGDEAGAAGAQEQRAPAEGLEPPAVPGPPLSRTGSRRQGDARCPREQRPPPRPAKVPGSGPPVPAASLGLREAAPGGWKLRAP
ncbi:PREDICTED: cyclic GMP-AMP synthase-like [Propithecus coquereli]|uniref:cyclic GMP-AMP synthase-like n=1 Tax=Propithecus coquereli TaxID=379532 RepID=UPI00063EE1EF|nr:PREDICTED: cyclic GMP-AMP synthase-like [Propithecus coquereli]